MSRSEREGIIARLDAFPRELASAAREAARIEAEAPPVDGQWSTRETVAHLAAVETEVYGTRLDDLDRDPEPRWSWVEPAPWSGAGSATLDGALAEFGRRRAATVARLRGLDDAAWRRSGVHDTFGRLDVAGLMREAIRHDEEHLASL